jgi:hypothetical protein
VELPEEARKRQGVGHRYLIQWHRWDSENTKKAYFFSKITPKLHKFA